MRHAHEHGVIVGRKAARYDRLSGFALRWLYRRAVDRVTDGLPADASVLDVGTGPGQLPLELANRRQDVRVIGIDPSSDMVRHATNRITAAELADRVQAREASAEELPFADGSFDAVVSTLSAHHWADVGAAITEQARVVRPGGALWVFDLRGKSPATVPQALRKHFGPDAVSRSTLGRLAGAFIVCYRAVRT